MTSHAKSSQLEEGWELAAASTRHPGSFVWQWSLFLRSLCGTARDDSKQAAGGRACWRPAQPSALPRDLEREALAFPPESAVRNTPIWAICGLVDRRSPMKRVRKSFNIFGSWWRCGMVLASGWRTAEPRWLKIVVTASTSRHVHACLNYRRIQPRPGHSVGPQSPYSSRPCCSTTCPEASSQAPALDSFPLSGPTIVTLVSSKISPLRTA